MSNCWNCNKYEATWKLVNKKELIDNNDLQAKVCNQCKPKYEINPLNGDQWIKL